MPNQMQNQMQNSMQGPQNQSGSQPLMSLNVKNNNSPINQQSLLHINQNPNMNNQLSQSK